MQKVKGEESGFLEWIPTRVLMGFRRKRGFPRTMLWYNSTYEE